jgi:hypothetical protein
LSSQPSAASPREPGPTVQPLPGKRRRYAKMNKFFSGNFVRETFFQKSQLRRERVRIESKIALVKKIFRRIFRGMSREIALSKKTFSPALEIENRYITYP